MLQPRTVIVPNMDIASWLQVHLAEEDGIAANLDFQLPAGFFRAQFERMDPRVREHLLDKPSLRWMIFTLLGEVEKEGKYSKNWDVLIDWLQSRGSGSQRGSQAVRWDLSGQIADVFDQYIMYRPDWLLAWERGERGFAEGEEPGIMHAWQPSFWKRLMDRWPETLHRARLMEDWSVRIHNDDHIRSALPSTIHVFNVKQVPPRLIEALIACSKVVDVHWYVSEHEFVGDYDDRFFKGLNAEQAEFRELFGELLERGGAQVLRFRVGAEQATVAPVLERDGGVVIHRCHSAHREVEVLRDRLLELFDTTELRPHEVAVVTPDPDMYAPFMREVFQLDNADGLRIPVRVQGGRKSDRALVAEAILQAMHLAGTRFKVTEVLDWMGQMPVLGSYMDEHRYRPLLHRWIEEQMIRWGSDREHVATADFELNGRHTWEHGFERLLLAKIGSEDQDFEFEGVLSGSAVITQAETEFLGRVLQVFDVLERLRMASKSTESVTYWVEFLSDIIDLCTDPKWKESCDQVRQQLYNLRKIDERIGLESVSLPILNSYLKEQLQKGGLGRSWHPGEVTFTGMVSLHTIPFKVVAILGLNDGSLPGRTPVSAFDLIPKFKRKGDRVRRIADRQMFLDYLVTPSEHLHVSYTGLRQTDNKSIAPSVMIPLMVDHLSRLEKVGRFVVPKHVQHRLQPFHPEYFNGIGVMHSYSGVNGGLAVALSVENAAETKTLLPELTPSRVRELMEMGPLGEVLGWDRATEVGVGRFLDFFGNPCRYVVKEVIGADLREGEVPSEDDEPLTIDGLSAWKMRNELVRVVTDEWVVSGCLPSKERVEAQMSGYLRRYELGGVVPDALAGQSRLEQIVSEARALIREFELQVAGLGEVHVVSPELNLDVDLSGGLGFRLTGSLPVCAGGRYIAVDPGSESPARDLKYWVTHVLHNTIHPVDTTIIFRGDAPTLLKYSSMERDQALKHVRNMGLFFVLGHSHLIPLYPSLCELYLGRMDKGADKLISLFAVQDALGSDDSHDRTHNDAKSEWVRHVWRDVDMMEATIGVAESGAGMDELDGVTEVGVEVLAEMDAYRVFTELVYKQMMEAKVK